MVHVDSRNKEHRQDVFFYHYGKDQTARDLAYNLQATFEEKYNQFQKGRGYHGFVDNRGLYMLRKVDPTAVYIELANIKNKSDHIRLMESANRQALANWLFEGLTDFNNEQSLTHLRLSYPGQCFYDTGVVWAFTVSRLQVVFKIGSFRYHCY